jgi:hypothetical protein
VVVLVLARRRPDAEVVVMVDEPATIETPAVLLSRRLFRVTSWPAGAPTLLSVKVTRVMPPPGTDGETTLMRTVAKLTGEGKVASALLGGVVCLNCAPLVMNTALLTWVLAAASSGMKVKVAT